LSELDIDESVLAKWLRVVEGKYRKNPYHNAMHGCDVLQGVFSMMLTLSETRGIMLSAKLSTALLLGAAMHDVGHPGRNNGFLVNTRDPVAILYNDTSVLENYHASTGFRVALADLRLGETGRDSGCNIFAKLSDDDFKELRTLMCTLVLATDMTQHFSLVDAFRSRIDNPDAPFRPEAGDDADALLLGKILIKASDINNPARAPETAQHWSKVVMEEFFEQGDAEAALGLPVSAFMDRSTADTARCQLGFLNYIVEPTYKLICGYMQFDEPMGNLRMNREYWEQRRSDSDAARRAAGLQVSSFASAISGAV